MNWDRIIKLNFGLLLFTLLMLWIRPLNDLRSYVLIGGRDFSDKVFVYGDSVMEQVFAVDRDADSIEILVAPLDKTSGGSYYVFVLDGEGIQLDSFETPIGMIPNSGLMKYHISDGLKSGRDYRIEVKAPELRQDTAIMVSSAISAYKKHFNVFAFLAIILAFSIANLWFVFEKYNIEVLSMPVLIATGLIMFLILAPGSAPDESFHYYSSLKMSNVLMGREDINHVEAGYEYEFTDGINANSAYVKQWSVFKKLSGDGREMISCEQGSSPVSNPLAHLAPAIGITIGRFMGLGFIGIYTLGRVFNMAQYIALVYMAIKLVPKNKELMLITAIVPMAMQQCTCMSYDSIVNGLSMLFTAYVLRMINNKKGLEIKSIVICTLIIIALAPIKVVYIILVLLLLAVSKDYAKKVLPIIGLAGMVLLFFKWRTIWDIMNNSVGEAWWTGGLESHTLSFVLEHPLRYIKAIVYSVENDGLTYLKDMIGIGLSTSRVAIPDYLAITYISIIVLCALTEKESILENKWQRRVFLLTSLIGTVAIFTVYLLNCTIYGQPRIMGVQGRYFIPFIVPVLYCIQRKKLKLDIDRRILFVPVWFIQIGYIVYALSQISYDI